MFLFLEDFMKNYWKDFSVYNINSIDRYASGFPLDQKEIIKYNH